MIIANSLASAAITGLIQSAMQDQKEFDSRVVHPNILSYIIKEKNRPATPAPRAKKAKQKKQELEVGPRSGPYLLVFCQRVNKSCCTKKSALVFRNCLGKPAAWPFITQIISSLTKWHGHFLYRLGLGCRHCCLLQNERTISA